MGKALLALGLLSLFAFEACASPAFFKHKALDEPDPSQAVSVQLNGETFINKGLVAFGLIPSNATESTGDTIGGIGSAIAIKLGTWARGTDGTFTGTLVVQPDRGFNLITTIDYQARRHEIDFVLSPYYNATDLSFTAAQATLKLDYRKTILHFERNDTKTSGLDPSAIRPALPGFPLDPDADPEMPIASTAEPHLTVDAEGLVANADGSYWTSDEYGPYIYRFSVDGHLIQTIQPPAAILPEINGDVNFTAEEDPTTGRAANQGFEGLSLDASTGTLYALLQSALIQDGGDDKSTSRFTRLLAFDVSDVDVRPELVGEWVVPLPQNSKGNTLATSEVHFVKENVFLTLARDGDGHGGDDTKSSYKQADLFDISKATDIHGSKFDEPSNSIATDGKLDESITPAVYVPFVNFINDTQLARFGLHNGKPNDTTLIDAKWESLALASVGDAAFPNDYFLFTASDNDFISTQGVALGVPFDAGFDNDNQFLVFRLTLPGAQQPFGLNLV